MTQEIEREDCGRCGGTGQVTKDVMGRPGLVPCPEWVDEKFLETGRYDY